MSSNHHNHTGMTLPLASLQSNTVFLPVLDDLLSPDFRPVLQTPTVENTTLINGPFVSQTQKSGSGPSTSVTTPMTANKLFIGSMCSDMSSSMTTCPSMSTSAIENGGSSENLKNLAASKIQRWWKLLKARKMGTLDQLDFGAERAKHSIRHMRTEEHILHLETEVNRLKTALAIERKMRQLQMDAIRSLWIQVQKMNNSAPVPIWDDNILLKVGTNSSETQTGANDLIQF